MRRRGWVGEAVANTSTDHRAPPETQARESFGAATTETGSDISPVDLTARRRLKATTGFLRWLLSTGLIPPHVSLERLLAVLQRSGDAEAWDVLSAAFKRIRLANGKRVFLTTPLPRESVGTAELADGGAP